MSFLVLESVFHLLIDSHFVLVMDFNHKPYKSHYGKSEFFFLSLQECQPHARISLVVFLLSFFCSLHLEMLSTIAFQARCQGDTHIYLRAQGAQRDRPLSRWCNSSAWWRKSKLQNNKKKCITVRSGRWFFQTCVIILNREPGNFKKKKKCKIVVNATKFPPLCTRAAEFCTVAHFCTYFKGFWKEMEMFQLVNFSVIVCSCAVNFLTVDLRFSSGGAETQSFSEN